MEPGLLDPDDSQLGECSDRSYGLFCIFDGHNGYEAAQFATSIVHEEVHQHLPRGEWTFGGVEVSQEWLAKIRSALSLAIVGIERKFALAGIVSGCTLSIILQTGWLLTVASLGDSLAFMDTGFQIVQLTADHRLDHNAHEISRTLSFEEQGRALVRRFCSFRRGPAASIQEGLGPLRVWPGGLAMGRALGDFDVGEAVISAPSVYQVRVPETGCRVIVASDGLWDCGTDVSTAIGKVRFKDTARAARSLLKTSVKKMGLHDDVSICVLDMMNEAASGAEEVMLAERERQDTGRPRPPWLAKRGGGGRGGGETGSDIVTEDILQASKSSLDSGDVTVAAAPVVAKKRGFLGRRAKKGGRGDDTSTSATATGEVVSAGSLVGGTSSTKNNKGNEGPLLSEGATTTATTTAALPSFWSNQQLKRRLNGQLLSSRSQKELGLTTEGSSVPSVHSSSDTDGLVDHHLEGKEGSSRSAAAGGVLVEGLEIQPFGQGDWAYVSSVDISGWVYAKNNTGVVSSANGGYDGGGGEEYHWPHSIDKRTAEQVTKVQHTSRQIWEMIRSRRSKHIQQLAAEGDLRKMMDLPTRV